MNDGNGSLCKALHSDPYPALDFPQTGHPKEAKRTFACTTVAAAQFLRQQHRPAQLRIWHQHAIERQCMQVKILVRGRATAGSYNVMAKATDNVGGVQTSTAVAITVGTLAITIDSPSNGAAITGDSVLISGTVLASQNSGVTVNGEVAALDANNRFYINLPLVAGSNNLTATVTTAIGQTATRAITVTSDGIAPLVQIDASPPQGIAPLTTTITVTNGGATDVNLQVNGSASGSVAAGQSASFPVTVTGPASVPITVTATDVQRNVTTRNFVLVAMDSALMDQRFKAIWGGLTDALASGEKVTAMTYFNSSAQAKYGPVFDALLPSMPQILASYSSLGRSDISSNTGEYVIGRTYRGAKRLYFIYFLLDTDGVWRIDSM